MGDDGILDIRLDSAIGTGKRLGGMQYGGAAGQLVGRGIDHHVGFGRGIARHAAVHEHLAFDPVIVEQVGWLIREDRFTQHAGHLELGIQHDHLGHEYRLAHLGGQGDGQIAGIGRQTIGGKIAHPLVKLIAGLLAIQGQQRVPLRQGDIIEFVECLAAARRLSERLLGLIGITQDGGVLLNGHHHATGTTGQQRGNHGRDRHLYQFHSSYLHNPVAKSC
ncbi:hypothetical protein D3C78_280690 [compost metagenome]